jgi:transglutaminase-like putative cysteine protease
MAAAMRAQARRAVDAGPVEPELGAPALRLACVVAAGTFAFARWLTLLERPPSGAAAAAAAAALATGAALVLAGRLAARARRVPAIASVLVVALAAALLVAAVPVSDLDPRSWGRLASGLGDGLGALPGLTVPYRGADARARTILVLGGMLLLLLAAAAAVWPRRPAPGSRLTAIAALAVLYAVPAVELTDRHPWRAGAAFTLGLAAVLYAERLRPRQAPAAVVTVLAVVVAGLIVAPRLDGGAPLVDLQKLATRLDGQNALSFTWDHRYGPLDWPRKGQVVARIDSKLGDYWKAETLERFDGTAWVAARPTGEPGPSDPTPVPHWRHQIAVSIGALRTRQFLGAGTTTYIWKSPRKPVAGTAGSYLAESRPLVNGDTYRARVYYPRPSERQMRRAGVAYPASTQDLDVTVPLTGGGRVDIGFGPFGFDNARTVTRLLSHSPYARAYALARRLRAGARTPYDYVLAVERHLQSGYAYDESPPRTRFPLATFLFDDRRGYCQHFSGAMTLLLRMGGVPARVAAGFSPGTPASPGGEFVVRDLDAHSWVEVLFPGIGWVTFDPTPQVAPPASQIGDPLRSSTPAPGGDRPGPTGRNADAGAKVGGGSGGAGGGMSWRTPLLALGALLVAGAGAAVALALRLERRRHPPTAPELAELERALRRSGRDPRPPTTLRDLERLLGPDERATGYLRAIQDARYDEAAAGPTDQERTALRRALGDGLGKRGRLRALWALPPRPRLRRRALQ